MKDTKQKRETTFNSIERVLRVFIKSEARIRPHFILTGATGSSKTYTVETLCKALGLELITVNSAQLTVEGVAGNSVSKSLSQLKGLNGSKAVVLFDEFDKLLDINQCGGGISSDITLNIQDEILKVVEGETTEVFGDYGKYVKVPCNNILFVFAGAFGGAEVGSIEDLLRFGVKPELLGRIGLQYHMDKMPLEEMEELVKSSNLIKDYVSIMNGSDLDKSVEAITKELQLQYDNNILGVRIIGSLAHQFFIDRKFKRVKPVEGGDKTKSSGNKLVELSLQM